MKKQVTKDQHYIPRVYLRGFSPEYQKGVPINKHTIWFYDLKKQQQHNKPVFVKSQCSADWLYEVRDDNGIRIFENHLEHYFCEIEHKFKHYRNMLERKAFIKNNQKTNCFLTTEEKGFWIAYIAIQILRLPFILELAEQAALKTFGTQFNKYQIRNAAIMSCLPFFKELNLEDDSFRPVISLINNISNLSSFVITADELSRFVTSDNPIIMVGARTFKTIEDIDEIIFPISSQICLLIFRPNGMRKNCLCDADDNIRECIIKYMVSRSNISHMLYSNHVLDETEVTWIKEAIIDSQS